MVLEVRIEVTLGGVTVIRKGNGGALLGHRSHSFLIWMLITFYINIYL